jgi:hypothetical protein
MEEDETQIKRPQWKEARDKNSWKLKLLNPNNRKATTSTNNYTTYLEHKA